MTDATFRTEINYVEVRGNHNGSLFAPNFYCVDVWMTDDRLEIRYSTEYGFSTRIVASITRTNDDFTLVGAHAVYDGDVVADTPMDEVHGDDTRVALLDYAGRVDALAKEFIVPQILRALVLRELNA